MSRAVSVIHVHSEEMLYGLFEFGVWKLRLNDWCLKWGGETSPLWVGYFLNPVAFERDEKQILRWKRFNSMWINVHEVLVCGYGVVL